MIEARVNHFNASGSSVYTGEGWTAKNPTIGVVSLVDPSDNPVDFSLEVIANSFGNGHNGDSESIGSGDAAWVNVAGVFGIGWGLDVADGWQTFKFIGCDPAKTYSYEATAQYSISDRILGVRVDGVEQTLLLSDDGVLNTTETLRFDNLSPDGSGEIVIEVRADPASSGRAALQASRLIEYDSTDPQITLDSAPTYGATISGSYANFAGTPTGPLTASDGTRAPTVAVTVDTGASTFTGTFPGLPPAGESLPEGSLPYPGNLSVTLPDPGA